ISAATPLHSARIVCRRTIDGRYLAPHMPQVSRELTTMMDRVEEHTPYKVFDRVLPGGRARHQELTLRGPPLLIELRHAIGHPLRTALERRDDVGHLGGWRLVLPFHGSRLEKREQRGLFVREQAG